MYKYLFILFLFSLKVNSDTQLHLGLSTSEYLKSSDVIVLVNKLDGELSLNEYTALLNRNKKLSREDLYNNWRSAREPLKDRFFVLKAFKGTKPLGSYIEAQVIDSISHLTERNAIYLVFFRGQNENNLTYSRCDVVRADSLYKELMALNDLTNLVDFIIESKRLRCLDKALK